MKVVQVFLINYFLTCALFVQTSVQAQSLSEADSLFFSGNGTYALKIYEDIFEQGEFTPQMLIKMAYIYNGLGNTVKTLYYLSLYEKLYPSTEIQEKMQQIANKQKLTGYQITDYEYFRTIYFQIKDGLEVSLYFVIVGLVIWSFFVAQRKSRKVLLLLQVAMLAVILLLFYVKNHLFQTCEGIIAHDRAFMMQAPSAGAQLLASSERGHKVKIKAERDIWYQIEWEGKEYFIRKSHVLKL